MARKEFEYRGKTIDELKKLSINEVAELLPSRARRCLKRGLSDGQKKLMERINSGSRKLRTHSRDMVVLPVMVGHTIQIYDGRQFVSVEIQTEMIGHKLGEYAGTRKRVSHSAPGIGATRSSSALSVR